MGKAIEIKINGIGRQKVNINGDEQKFVELNLNDAGVIERMKEAIPNIEKAVDKYKDIELSDDSLNDFDAVAGMLLDIDKEIKKQINFIYDYDVCTPILGNMSTMSPVDGDFIFLQILKSLTPLYTDEISKQMTALNKSVNKHVQKYITKK